MRIQMIQKSRIFKMYKYWVSTKTLLGDFEIIIFKNQPTGWY